MKQPNLSWKTPQENKEVSSTKCCATFGRPFHDSPAFQQHPSHLFSRSCWQAAATQALFGSAALQHHWNKWDSCQPLPSALNFDRRKLVWFPTSILFYMQNSWIPFFFPVQRELQTTGKNSYLGLNQKQRISGVWNTALPLLGGDFWYQS